MKESKKSELSKLDIVIRALILMIIIAIMLLIINMGIFNSEKYLKAMHPINYSEIIEQAALEYGLDRFLIYAVIKTESGFKSDAVSDVGARGLMQIMPETFEWLKDYRFFDENLTFDSMYNPENNIRYGVHLISYHMGHYNDTDNALAAYHAGGGNVDSWLGDSEYSSDGKTLDEIPIPETAHYVNKVNKAYEIYLKLYGN